MRKCSARPYEGNDKYIFISYCHRDRAHVFPIIEQLVKDGYRVWYDEGIDPGSEWPEIIARHLNGCLICMAFISENSLNSHNCRREINFALMKKKFFISVMLEPVKMSLGMEMQLSVAQSIFKYNMASDKLFFDKLYEAKELEGCLGNPDSSVIVSRYEDYMNESGAFDKVRDPFSDKWFVNGAEAGDNAVRNSSEEDRRRREEAQRQEEARRAAEEAQRQEEARRAAEEARCQEEARRAAEEARCQEEARRAAEEARCQEEARRAAEEARCQEEARRAAEEAQRQEEARRAEELHREEAHKAAEEAERRLEEARRAAAEARRLEEEARRLAEEARQREEEARKAAEEEERRRREEEARKAAEEEERKRREEEARKAAEEAERRRREEEARKAAEEAERRRREEEARKAAEEEERRRREEEARKAAEEEERRRREEEARKAAEEEERRRREEEARKAEEEDEDGKTIMVDDFSDSDITHMLKREKTNEIIAISKRQFIIGRSESKADYVITDNRSVSRVHATLSVMDEKCYITDNNSLNRTFVNDRVLEPDVPYELKNGDGIKICNERFVYLKD